MPIVIVPNVLSAAIYKRVDTELEKHPELKAERENIYHDILSYYHEHGVIPDFQLAAK